MIGVPFVAKSDPPKLPIPELVRVTVAVLPALRLASIPQTSTHLALPLGHAPRMRNCPADTPVSPREAALVRAKESAMGTPIQKGSLVRVTPEVLPGYKDSWIVRGTLRDPPVEMSSK